jgi:hypothetical protein
LGVTNFSKETRSPKYNDGYYSWLKQPDIATISTTNRMKMGKLNSR